MQPARTNVSQAASRAVLRPDAIVNPSRLYPWLLLLALLDVFFTSHILNFGGIEVNAIADRILQRSGVLGLLVFKISSIVLVVLICEYIARRGDRRATRLAEWGIALNAIPVAVGGAQLAAFLAQSTPVAVL